MTLPDLRVHPTDALTVDHRCIVCLRSLSEMHLPRCTVTKERFRNASPDPTKYRFIPVEE